jgi:hypothetical protein
VIGSPHVSMASWRMSIASAIAVAHACTSAPALADQPIPAVRFEVHAPAGCPSDQEFVQRVETRTAVHMAEPGQSARTFVVTLTEPADASADTYRGELVVREADGRTSARSIAGTTSDEVAAALAVIIAIELNPEADRPDVGIEPSPPQAPGAQTPSPPAPAAPERPAELPLEPRWRAGAVLGSGIMSAISDSVSATIALSFELRRESDRLLAPSFRFGLTTGPPGIVTGPDGQGSLFLFAPTLEGCPLQVRFAARRVVLEPCGTFEIGFLFASGSPASGGDTGRRDLRPWAALGATARALWTFREPFFVEVAGTIFTPLVRDQFYIYTPNVALFEAPGVGYRGSCGIGVHFL